MREGRRKELIHCIIHVHVHVRSLGSCGSLIFSCTVHVHVHCILLCHFNRDIHVHVLYMYKYHILKQFVMWPRINYRLDSVSLWLHKHTCVYVYNEG